MKFKYLEESHRYYLDGASCKGISSQGKVFEYTGSLEAWKIRQAMIGVAISDHIRESVAAHYDDYNELEQLAEQAMEAAGSHLAAHRGTTMHRIAERLDRGETVIETPLAKQTMKRWRDAVSAAELEVVPEYIERFVVYPEWKLCGRFDRLMRRKSDGALVVVDLKTGEKALKYTHSVAIQLALYAHAPFLIGETTRQRKGKSTAIESEELIPMPEVDLTRGYALHMPSEDEARIVPIKLEPAWEMVTNHLWAVYDWRGRDDLAELDPKGDDMKRLQIVRRIENLTTDQRGELAKAWPKGVPTLKASGDHTETQLSAIVDVLDRIAGFEVDDLSRDRVPDEGMTMSDEDIAVIRQRVNELDSAALFVFSMLGKQASEAGTAVELAKHRSERRYEITRAALRLAAYTGEGYADETSIELLTPLFDGPIPSTATPGAVLSAMTIDEARQTAAVLDALIAGTSVATYTDGHLSIVPAA